MKLPYVGAVVLFVNNGIQHPAIVSSVNDRAVTLQVFPAKGGVIPGAVDIAGRAYGVPCQSAAIGGGLQDWYWIWPTDSEPKSSVVGSLEVELSMAPTRSEARRAAYVAIDSERAYQEAKWPGHAHEAESYCLFLGDYLAEARRQASRLDLSDPKYLTNYLDTIRKVVALGVACLEQHGAPKREGF